MSTNMSEFRSLPLAAITFSTTTSQIERRAHFDKVQLGELAESIKAVGVVQPILVRPFRGENVKGEAFEVVAGERRAIAAKQAGLKDIPVTVRELTDEQVLELQLIENLQRQDLHELAEAEGYEQLLKLSHTVDDIAAKVGKSRGTVYARMKLLALFPDARKAYYGGQLSASTALLIARIPGEEQQQRALEKITEEGYQGRTMTYREAQSYVHDTFMLKLSTAPFPRDDVTLVPDAGACGNCPMRTGNQPELFGDVKGADVCTNPPCFQAKKAAHVRRELDKARESGETVIKGGDARRILPDSRGYYYDSSGSGKQLRNGYARPGDKCLDDPKKRTYAELAGKDAPRVLLQNPDSDRVEKVFKLQDIADRLKVKGIKVKPAAKGAPEAREQDNERREQLRKIDLAARAAIFQAIMKAAPTKLERTDLEALVTRMAYETGYGYDEGVYAVLGWEQPKKRLHGAKAEAEFALRVRSLSEPQLAQLAVAVTVIDEATENYGQAEALEALAKRFDIDTKKIRAAAAPPEPEEKPEPVKAAAKKKPAPKPKAKASKKPRAKK